MLSLERGQSSKRRTLFLRPRYSRAEETMRVEPLPQQQFELLFEGIRRGEILKRGLELTLFRPKPLAPECLERVELGLRLYYSPLRARFPCRRFQMRSNPV